MIRTERNSQLTRTRRATAAKANPVARPCGRCGRVTTDLDDHGHCRSTGLCETIAPVLFPAT